MVNLRRRLQDKVRDTLTANPAAMQRFRTQTPLDDKPPTETAGLPPAYDAHQCNVIIFGETGAGKSSVINLIAGSKVAATSPDAAACTLSSKAYTVVLESNRPYHIWDTVGLNEAGLDHNQYLLSIEQAYKLIKELERSGGVHLLLLCMRGGRITNTVQQNYKLFSRILCNGNVPLAVVVTHLENEPSMENWWTANERTFSSYGISNVRHACITATPGLDNVCLSKYQESKETMHRLLLAASTGTPWKNEPRIWFVAVMGKMARMFPHMRSKPSRRELIERLVKECRFSPKDAEGIAASIEAIRDQP
ncbi:hypothetical protein HYDPIDRAFT_25496 [Hydnomerulius pinastri MD-312]|nr:hypothetical protein HYDPIDRAFT_25496 [Hydnomerulius pinastri MD-312]